MPIGIKTKLHDAVGWLNAVYCQSEKNKAGQLIYQYDWLTELQSGKNLHIAAKICGYSYKNPRGKGFIYNASQPPTKEEAYKLLKALEEYNAIRKATGNGSLETMFTTEEQKPLYVQASDEPLESESPTKVPNTSINDLVEQEIIKRKQASRQKLQKILGRSVLAVALIALGIVFGTLI